MPKGIINCCVVGCSNTYSNTEGEGVIFYSFPGRPYEKERREKWISSVKRINEDGTPWQPTKYSKVCSDHFISKKKRDHPAHPDYVPSVFPELYKKRNTNGTQRFHRLQKREKPNVEDADAENNIPQIETFELPVVDKRSEDKCIQASYVYKSDTFVFSLERFENSVATQVDICFHTGTSNIPIPTHDAATFTDEGELINEGFCGFSSITDEKQLKSLSGVSYAIFYTLLNGITVLTKQKMSKENRLLLFLMKLKLGLSYAALGVLFQVHSTTASSVFELLTREIAQKTKDLIFWPSRFSVNSTMPPAFKIYYPSTRVIIDCTEMKCEQPYKISHRYWLYSNYKGCYTVKFLIGICPNGFISFVSKCYGGRATDTFITIDSGFPNLLEPGDIVLADKGFPGIQTAIKNSIFVTPPFVHQGILTPQEVETTYNIASVRIHVERCIQQIKTFGILKYIPMTLMPLIDDIIHICCVLTNMQSPIIKIDE